MDRLNEFNANCVWGQPTLMFTFWRQACCSAKLVHSLSSHLHRFCHTFSMQTPLVLMLALAFHITISCAYKYKYIYIYLFIIYVSQFANYAQCDRERAAAAAADSSCVSSSRLPIRDRLTGMLLRAINSRTILHFRVL